MMMRNDRELTCGLKSLKLPIAILSLPPQGLAELVKGLGLDEPLRNLPKNHVTTNDEQAWTRKKSVEGLIRLRTSNVQK